jgi:UbiD family decarboxylase
MAYSSLEECLLDLEKNGQLLRIKKDVDPYLEMATIHLRIHEAHGPAILFEKVKDYLLNNVTGKVRYVLMSKMLYHIIANFIILLCQLLCIVKIVMLHPTIT